MSAGHHHPVGDAGALWNLYEIDLRLNGHAPVVAYVAATKMEARDLIRREGARIWAGGLGRYWAVRLSVRRRSDNAIVLEWMRPRARTVYRR